jgi:putative hydrolase
MSDSGGPEGLPEPGDDDALLRFLAQFGITPDASGQMDLNQVMGRMQSMLAAFNTQLAGFGKADADSGMNWGFTLDLTRRAIAGAGSDPQPDAATVGRIRDAVALADLWLDEEIAFDRLTAPAVAWRRVDWVEQTFETWQGLVRPVISQLAHALHALVDRPDAATAEPMLRLAVAGMFAAQVSDTLGDAATTVVSGTDIGLPVTRPLVAILPTNVAAFADGLAASPEDVLLYLAIREAARQRLFASVGWLGPQLMALIEHYAREITIDPDGLERAIESQLGQAMTARDLEAAGTAVAHSLFAPQRTPEQAEVLERLEILLAVVEGWVDEVVARVAEPRMPSAAGLTETLRRRRASGGPAENALKTLVGLELRPRRTRDAANLWAATRASRGAEGRDAVWAHPDLMPTSADLDDPLGFANAEHSDAAPDDLDAALARLLDEEGGPAAPRD